MKKILSILAAVGLTTTSASAVVACGDKPNADEKITTNNLIKEFAIKDYKNFTEEKNVYHNN